MKTFKKYMFPLLVSLFFGSILSFVSFVLFPIHLSQKGFLFSLGLESFLIFSLLSYCFKIIPQRLFQKTDPKKKVDSTNKILRQSMQTAYGNPSGVRSLFRDQDYFTLSKPFQKILKLELNEEGKITHTDYLNMVIPEDRHKVIQSFSDERIKNEDYSSTYRMKTIDGEEVVLNEFIINNNPSNQREIILIANDISAQIVDHIKAQFFEVLFENSQSGLLLTDHHNKIIAVNKEYSRITGYSYDEIKGLDPNISASGKHNSVFYKSMWKELNNKGIWEGEIFDKTKDGNIIPKQLFIKKINEPINNQNFHIGIFTDLSIMKEYELELGKLTYYDLLTSVYNRNYFYEKSLVLLKNSQDKNLNSAIIYLNIVNLSDLNKLHGMNSGDLVLIEISKILESNVDEHSIVSRFAGKFFVILLTQLQSKGDVISYLNTINRQISDGVVCYNGLLHPEVTMGIHFFNKVGENIPLLVEYASIANTACLESGAGSNYLFYTLELSQKKDYLKNMSRRIKVALEKDEFYLDFQPQFNIINKSVCGIEVLARWKESLTGKLISPYEFISVAEKTGQIGAIGKLILEKAFSILNIWNLEFGKKMVPLSINVSVVQFQDPNFVNHIKLLLEKYDIPGELIKLEITENIIATDKNKLSQIFSSLSLLGIRVAIDDFGTGFSSLSYLHHFPVDELKLDRTFIVDLENDDRIFKAIVSIADSLGIPTVCEGVETNEQLHQVRKLGCDVIQGYLFSKPVGPEILKNILKTNGSEIFQNKITFHSLETKNIISKQNDSSQFDAHKLEDLNNINLACIAYSDEEVNDIRLKLTDKIKSLNDFNQLEDSLQWLQIHRPDIVLLNIKENLQISYEKILQESPESLILIFSEDAKILKSKNDPSQFIFDFIEKPGKDNELSSGITRAMAFRKEFRELRLNIEKRERLSRKKLEWMEWKLRSVDEQQIKHNLQLIGNIWLSVSQGNGFGLLTTTMSMLQDSANKSNDGYLVDATLLDMTFEAAEASRMWINNLGKIDKIFLKKYDLQILDNKGFSEMINNAIVDTQEFSKIKNHEIEINESGKFNFEVQLNRDAFEMVLRELIVNSFKYSPGNSIVKLYYYRSGKELILRITNSILTYSKKQEGIPESAEFLIFEPFFRLNKAIDDRFLNEELGIGIGLTVVKNVLEKFNARIYIHNVDDYSIQTNPARVVSADITLPLLQT